MLICPDSRTGHQSNDPTPSGPHSGLRTFCWSTHLDLLVKKSSLDTKNCSIRLDFWSGCHLNFPGSCYSPDDPQLKILIAKAKICLLGLIQQWGQIQIMGGGDKHHLPWSRPGGTHSIVHLPRYMTDSISCPWQPYWVNVLMQYQLQVDQKVWQSCQPLSFKWKIFIGQLEHVITLKIPQSANLCLLKSETIVLALVRTYNAEWGADSLWQYTCFCDWEFIDLTAIKCLVRQVRNGKK